MAVLPRKRRHGDWGRKTHHSDGLLQRGPLLAQIREKSAGTHWYVEPDVRSRQGGRPLFLPAGAEGFRSSPAEDAASTWRSKKVAGPRDRTAANCRRGRH